MSTKTIFKRIALVAASALAAGSLAVVAVPSANAFNTDDGYISSTSGSIGLVAAGTLASNTADTTKSGVILSTGTLKLTVTSNDGATLVVSAGAKITNATDPLDISADQTCAALATTDFASITPTGAAGTTFTVSIYSQNTCATAATLTERATVTIASASASGVVSASDSIVRWDNGVSGSAPTAAEDVTSSETTTGLNLNLYIQLRDAYLADISSSAGALVVTASSGAYLGALATSSAAAGTGTLTTQVYSGDPSPAIWVVLREATSGAGWKGTVTVTYNGVLIATKSGAITGAPSKIEVQPYKIARTGTSDSAQSFLFTVKDAAGNGLDSVAAANLAMDSSSNAAVVSGIHATSAVAPSSTSPFGAYVGAGGIICTGSAGAAGGGTSNLVLSHTLSNGTVIKSNSFTATCGGDATTFTASLDKASYVQGEVATLTMTFRDGKGNLANSVTKVANGTGTTNDAVISVPMMALVGSLGAGDDMKPNGKGQIQLKYTVGTSSGLTAGKYNAIVQFPTLTLADPVSVSYEVGTGSTAVSTNEVLAAIVKLIATINKQIRQLQKQLRR